MPLKMKSRCEKCQAELLPYGEAYICSYECTFCAACAETLAAQCPNCLGELLRRPKRTTPVATVAVRSAGRLWRRLLNGSA